MGRVQGTAIDTGQGGRQAQTQTQTQTQDDQHPATETKQCSN
jgi:hypothetical protein